MVRQIARPYGTVKKLKAFFNPANSESNPTNTEDLRSEIQLQAVDVTSCGFLDGENVVKAMLGEPRRQRCSAMASGQRLRSVCPTVDMMIDIVDLRYHAPPVMIIISGDRSLEYTSRLLQDRRYNVVLFKTWDDAKSTALQPEGGLVTSSPANATLPSGSSTDSSAPGAAIKQLEDTLWAVDTMPR